MQITLGHDVKRSSADNRAIHRIRNTAVSAGWFEVFMALELYLTRGHDNMDHELKSCVEKGLKQKKTNTQRVALIVFGDEMWGEQH